MPVKLTTGRSRFASKSTSAVVPHAWAISYTRAITFLYVEPDSIRCIVLRSTPTALANDWCECDELAYNFCKRIQNNDDWWNLWVGRSWTELPSCLSFDSIVLNIRNVFFVEFSMNGRFYFYRAQAKLTHRRYLSNKRMHQIWVIFAFSIPKSKKKHLWKRQICFILS